jgi:hypothetical protein
MRTQIILIFFLILSTSLLGQEISSNQDISNSKDKTIASVRDFWIAYIKDISKSNNSDKNLIYSKYWNKFEIGNGFTDIINDALPVYSIGKLQIKDIRKVQDVFFQIKNQVELNGKVIAVFNIYVKEEGSSYKLYNQLFFSKSTLNHYQNDNIDFYYPNKYLFNVKKADELSDSYVKLSDLYGNHRKNKVTYLIGNTFNEASKFIGIETGILSSDSPYAGFTIKNQNLILSSREDHLHEIIHLVFFSLFPDSPYIFNEGVATYYGGTGGKDYKTLINNLKVLIKTHPDIDLSDFDSINKTLDDGTNYCYIVGAILIEYAYRTGGAEKVLSLFKYSTNNQNWDDPQSTIEKVLGIEKDQINSFIKAQIP